MNKCCLPWLTKEYADVHFHNSSRYAALSDPGLYAAISVTLPWLTHQGMHSAAKHQVVNSAITHQKDAFCHNSPSGALCHNSLRGALCLTSSSGALYLLYLLLPCTALHLMLTSPHHDDSFPHHSDCHVSTPWWLSCLHTMVTLTAPHHGDPHISTSWWPHVSIPKAPHHGDSHLHIVVTACLHTMVSLIFPHHGDSHISTPSPWWLHGYTLGWPSCLHTWDGHMQLTGCQNPTAN